MRISYKFGAIRMIHWPWRALCGITQPYHSVNISLVNVWNAIRHWDSPEERFVYALIFTLDHEMAHAFTGSSNEKFPERFAVAGRWARDRPT